MSIPTLNIGTLQLKAGSHRPDSGEACLLEAVSFVAGEPWSDRPQCVSQILGAYGRKLNDVLPDSKRQQLVPLIPKLIGTAGDGLDEQRSYLALDWLIRTYLPTWMRLVPALVPQADLIAGRGPIRTLDDAAAIGDLVREAAAQSAAAWAAAGAAAGDAAGDAAWDAAGAAAWDAAWDAAGGAAWDAARAAAWDAARAAAWDAAWAAARAAARAAAGAAAWDAMAPTVGALQDSAITLFGTMISGGAA